MPAAPRLRHLLPALLVAVGCAASAAGLDIHGEAKLEDIGLPLYPGAVKASGDNDPSGGFTFGLWGDAFGIHVYAADFHSADQVEPIAAFYRDAMARYGTVVDCTVARPKPAPAPASGPKHSTENLPVTCDDDHARPGGHLYKVGTQGDHRIVDIDPRRAGSHLQLMHLIAHGMD